MSVCFTFCLFLFIHLFREEIFEQDEQKIMHCDEPELSTAGYDSKIYMRKVDSQEKRVIMNDRIITE